MARRDLWEATGRAADVYSLLSALAALGIAAAAVLLATGGSGLDTVALTATGALFVTGVLIFGVGVRSRLDSYLAFAPDRGKRATVYLRLGTFFLVVAVLAGAVLAWGAYREPSPHHHGRPGTANGPAQ